MTKLIQVLQEVAAARRILIICGLAEIDGYAFCLGLEPLLHHYIDLQDLDIHIRSVTYLIRQAKFRPTQIPWSDMSFLAICPLGELLDMFHAHEATWRHDKVYALLGMSTDARNAVDLLPDYKISWGEVFQRLIKFLLHKQVSVKTWDKNEVAVIKSNGRILGEVSSVVSHLGWSDTHKLVITPKKNASRNSGYMRNWSAPLTVHTSAKSIRQGDLVYFLQGALKPTIIRRCRNYFAVIRIEVTPPEYIRAEGKNIRWSELLGSVEIFPHDFLLIWDWAKSSGEPQDRGEYEKLLEADPQMHEHAKTEFGDHLDMANRLGNMALILEYLEEYEEAVERLREARRVCEKVFGGDHPRTLASMKNLASMYRKQGKWKEAEELELQVVETRRRVLGVEHPDTITSMSKLVSMYKEQEKWKEAEELGIKVIEIRRRVLEAEHPDIITSMSKLASIYEKQGKWKEAEELEMQVIEIRRRVLGMERLDTIISISKLALI